MKEERRHGLNEREMELAKLLMVQELSEINLLVLLTVKPVLSFISEHFRNMSRT